MLFFFEVLLSGLLSGLMYSLVALGFVLIYKASGVCNFAQGAMEQFAALAVVGLLGKGVRAMDFGIVDEPIMPIMDRLGIGISKFDLFASGTVIALVALLALFFQRTKLGRALRAVADDHQAALSLGIPLQHIWAVVWGVAGFVALVAGLLWGSRNGVQFALTMT